jgi:hypothetical protein
MALGQHTEGIEHSGSGSTNEADLVEAALRFGQRRDLILGSAFANPAWEIMLWLYSKALKDSDASLETLMAETERSNLTQRWIDALVQDGLVMIASPGGVSVVRLTTHGKASMDALFASAQAGTAVS